MVVTEFSTTGPKISGLFIVRSSLYVLVEILVAIEEVPLSCCSENPVLVILFTQEGYDTRSIFKRSLTALNSEFSFS